MSLFNFFKPSNPKVPPPGTYAHKAYLRVTGNPPVQGVPVYKVPPPGTYAHKAYLRVTGKSPVQGPSAFAHLNGGTVPSVRDFSGGRIIPSVRDFFGLDPEPNNPSPTPYSPTAKGLYSAPADTAVLDYLNADLAKYYGMSKATAYQEALSNTSYQRAVKDMRAAGLNPAVLFGSGHAQGASSSVYASDAHSGGGYSFSRGSGSSGNGKLFSSGLYYGISTAVGLATAYLTKNPANYWIGSAGAQGVMGTMNAVLKK